MLTKILESVETLERERERESNNTKNVATKVALVSIRKNRIDDMKLVM